MVYMNRTGVIFILIKYFVVINKLRLEKEVDQNGKSNNL
jgi:hypothetical protein